MVDYRIAPQKKKWISTNDEQDEMRQMQQNRGRYNDTNEIKTLEIIIEGNLAERWRRLTVIG